MRAITLYLSWALIAFLLYPPIAVGQQYIPESTIPPTITRDAEIIPTGETNAVCIGNTATPTPSIQLCATLDVTGKTTYYKPPEVTVSALPSNHSITVVTDSTTPTSCTTGGGTNKVVCWWNGTAWTALGGTGGGSGDVTDVFGTGGGTGANEICVANPGGPQPTLALCSTVSILAKVLQLGRVDLAGVITPATLTTNTADWNPANLSGASTIRIAVNPSITLSGIQGGASGRILTLLNVGTLPVILANDSSASTASNRFLFGADISLGPNQGIIVQYDNTTARWRGLGGVGGGLDYCADAGTTDAYACNLSPAITAYTVGKQYSFKANTGNTGPATISFNSLTATTIKKVVGGVNTDLADNDIRAGQIVQVVFDGSNMQMASMLANSPTGISGLTTNCLPKAASSTTINDSSVCEDADSVNVSKSIEIGSVGTNAFWWDGTGVTGQISMKFQTARTKSITFRIGSDTGAALVDTQDEKDIWENNIAAMHIIAIKCRTDAGTSTINLQRNDGTPANILSSNLSCTTTGATSSTFTSGEDAIALGHMIDFVLVSAGGTAKRITVTITAMVDSGS